MKKISAFQAAKPRTAKGEARRREAETMRTMGDLADMENEEEFKRALQELFGIKPGDPEYKKAMAIWAEIQRDRI
ncbi:MAG: hypothetical protein ABR908_00275 [Terriglobales bacterium]|jgi:hypothetical protein